MWNGRATVEKALAVSENKHASKQTKNYATRMQPRNCTLAFIPEKNESLWYIKFTQFGIILPKKG